MESKAKLYLIGALLLVTLITVSLVNYNGMEYSINMCVEDGRTPSIDKELFGLNWSVSCE